MIRVKYTEVYGLLRTDWFTVGPNLVIRGVINTTNNYYELREFDNKLITSGTAKTLRAAKTKVKELLQEAGVNFGDEIRRRG